LASARCSDRRHQPLGQRPLLVEGERPLERHRLGRRRLALHDLAQETGQEVGQIVEDGVDACRGAAGLELVEQGVVGRAAQRRGLGGCGLAHQAEQLLQLGQHHGEVGLGAGLAPDHLAGVAGPAQGLDQGRLQRGLVQPAAAHLAQIGARPGVEARRAVLGRGEEIGQRRIGDQLVAGQIEGGELFGARLRAARGHHGRGVPLQQTGRLAERAQALEARFQVLIGGHLIPSSSTGCGRDWCSR
jgi:hypothetical protein